MRRAAKIDTNQNEIVDALRLAGATVAITSAVGGGFPDLVVGYECRNYLIEVKDGKKSPSKQRLTPDQKIFLFGDPGNEKSLPWAGSVTVVNSVEAALAVIGLGLLPVTA